MDGRWSQLDVLRVFGLDSDTIPSVCLLHLCLVPMVFTDDPSAMRRVLHLKMVTQCAMLEEFGIFLVLADKVGYKCCLFHNIILILNFSLSSRTILKLLFLRLHMAHIHHRSPKS